MKSRLRLIPSVICLCALSVTAGSPSQGLAQSPAPTSIRVYPSEIKLNTSRDRQSYIVQAVFADGLTQDATAQATATIANSALVRQEGNMIYPVADGATELKLEYAGHSATIPVQIEQSTADRPISFRLDVMPVFMKSGCNMGSCHGAARGKDGFRLSLFGFDPEGDHFRLTREISTRRLNLALPHECLLIEKTAGKVPHTGGKRFEEGSEYYNTLIRWLEAG
ncbi:MAG: cell surface protein, partial [Planctomycetaceae bacterium]